MFARLASKFTVAFSIGWDFFRPRKRLGIVSFVLLSSLVIVFFFVTTKIVHADILPSAGDIMKWFAEILLALAGFCIKLTFFVLKFIIEVAGYNGFIDSPAVTVGWVMIRDITNMLFVVVLLAIAFGTILGIDSYEYKHSLVKLIGAAILVNFSRVICGLIIDIAQVVMVTFVNGIAATASGNLLNMFQVDQIFKVSAGGATTGTPSATFLAGVAALAFSVIMLVTMLAFLFMILARMVMLWILIALSPFAFVLKILHQTEQYAGMWWGQFGSNVVSGPVIAFFLWLSFVTVGSGTIHDEIKQHNALDRGLTLETVSPEEETVGITSITSWDKMANFIIAVAILLAGAKVAGELGVVGAGMMSSAGELGKKVAMYASGYKAARWLAPQIGKGLYYGSNMVPGLKIIHPEQWKRRAAGLKADIAEKYYAYRGRQAKKAGDMAKAAFEVGEDGKYKDKSLGGWLNRAEAWLRLEGGNNDEFHHEKLEDKIAAAEARKEQIPHLVSTSKLSVGRKKLANKMRLHELETTGGDIKHAKEAVEEERRDHIMDEMEKDLKANGKLTDATIAKLKAMGLSGGDIQDMLADSGRRDKAAKGKAEAHVVKEVIDTDKKLKEAKALQDYIHHGDGHDKEHHAAGLKAEVQQIEGTLHSEKELEELKQIEKRLGGIEQAALNKAKAAVESKKEEVDLQRSKDTLLARADQYNSNQEYLKEGLARQQAHSLELNKMKEVFKSADIGANERANIAAQITAEIKAVRANSALTPEDRTAALRKLVKQKDSLNDLNSTLGSYDALKEEEEELRALGWSESLNADNIARRFLSRKIGRVVASGGEQAALDEYKEIVGSEEFANRMRQLGAHAKNQVGKAVTSAVAFAESPNKDASGKLTGLTDYDPKLTTSVGEVVGTLRAYYAGGDLKPSEMREAVGERVLKNGGGTILTRISSDAEAEFNAEMIGSYDDRQVSSMQNSRPFINDLNASDIGRDSLERQLVALAKKAKNNKAFIELCKQKLKSIITKNSMTETDLEELFENATRTTQVVSAPSAGRRRLPTV